MSTDKEEGSAMEERYLERLHNVQAGSPNRICGRRSRRPDSGGCRGRSGIHSLPKSLQHLQQLGLPVDME